MVVFVGLVIVVGAPVVLFTSAVVAAVVFASVVVGLAVVVGECRFNSANACSEYLLPSTTLLWSHDTSHSIKPPRSGRSRIFCKRSENALHAQILWWAHGPKTGADETLPG